MEYCCYPPVGRRGLGLTRQNFWGEKELLSRSPILIPQIESREAIDNLSQIVQYDFDYYLIGPYDLSLSLGEPGEFKSDRFLCYTKKINKYIPFPKMAVHLPTNVKEHLELYKSYGLKCLGMDTIALLEYHKEINHV